MGRSAITAELSSMPCSLSIGGLVSAILGWHEWLMVAPNRYRPVPSARILLMRSMSFQICRTRSRSLAHGLKQLEYKMPKIPSQLPHSSRPQTMTEPSSTWLLWPHQPSAETAIATERIVGLCSRTTIRLKSQIVYRLDVCIV